MGEARFEVLEYTLKVRTPLRLGSGVQVGVINEAARHSLRGDGTLLVPGYTLRGLIGSQMLKLWCRMPSPTCTRGLPCELSSSCPAYRALREWRHGLGCYFHYGLAKGERGGLSTSVEWRAKVYRDLRASVKGLSPFAYEAFTCPGGHAYVKSRVLVEEPLAEVVERAILAVRHQCLGGRRSWGWGLVEEVDVRRRGGLELDRIQSPVRGREVRLKVETPLPLTPGGDLTTTINRALSDITLATLRRRVVAQSARLDSLTGLVTISWWSEAEGKPYRALAIKQGSLITLTFNSAEEASSATAIAEHIGLTPSDQWYSKCGLGLSTSE